MFAVDLLNMAFITLRELPFMSICRGFIINGYQILLTAFSATIEMIMEKQSLQVVGWEN